MKKESIEYNGLKAGIIIFIGLLAFFLIMKAVGLLNTYELRAFNILIMGGGIYYAIKSAIKNNPNFDYLKGMGTGLLAGISASLAFAIFNLLYLLILDPEFMVEVTERRPFSEYLNPFTVALVILMEGVASGVIISLGLMQWFKSRGNSTEIKKKESNEPTK